jgi:hypothetical protein
MAICAGPTCTLNAIRESPSAATERELLAHSVPRRSIGQPAIGLKQHRRDRRRDQSGLGAMSCAPGGLPKAPSEATHVQDYSTAHDAYDGGVRAADKAITALTSVASLNTTNCGSSDSSWSTA